MRKWLSRAFLAAFCALFAAATLPVALDGRSMPLTEKLGLFGFGVSYAFTAAYLLGAHRFFRGLMVPPAAFSLALFGFGLPFVGLGLSAADGTNGDPEAAYFVVPIGAAISLAGLYGLAFKARLSDVPDLLATARRLGLTELRRSIFRLPSARGRVGALDVVVAEGEETRTVTISAPAIPSDLVLAPERIVELLPESLATGDGEFDREVFVRGDPASVLGLLDAATRELVRRAVRVGAIVRGRTVRWSDPSFQRVISLPDCAALLVELANALAKPPDLRACLSDPVAGVRLRALDLLERANPSGRRELLAGALSDPAGRVRLHAAMRLLADPDAPSELRLRAEEVARAAGDGALSLDTEDERGRLSAAATAGAVTLAKK